MNAKRTPEVDMDYQKALEYLDSRIVFGITPGLERIEELLKLVKNPQLSYPVIQVTGSNGKSSVTRMISQILAESDFRVGAYTSPHLHSYTERITIDGEGITKKDFAAVLQELVPLIEKVDEETKEPLTHFEILTALAFLCFHHKQIEAAVVEVGMGGRWDATSAASPKVAIITNIELEHTDILGKTVTAIAEEKAHIIKENSRALVGPLTKEALKIVKERSQKLGVNLKQLGQDFYPTSYSLDQGKQELSVKGLFRVYEGLNLSAMGRHQAQNLALAVAGAETFNGWPLEKPKVQKALEKLDFPGRMEKIRLASTTIVLDGAHNPAAARSLAQAVKENFSWEKLFLILAIFKDKDFTEVLKELAPLADLTVLSENTSERRAPVEILASETRKLTQNYVTEPNLNRAIDFALEKAGPGDLVLITGSLYTVAEAREYLSLKNRVLGSQENKMGRREIPQTPRITSASYKTSGKGKLGGRLF